MNTLQVAMRGVAVAVLIVLTLSACTAPKTAPVITHAADPLTFSIHQERSDYGIRQLQLGVTNTTDAAITIDSLTFSAAQFAAPVVAAEGGYDLPAGITTDFPVVLPAASCDATPTTGKLSATFRWPNGDAGSAGATPNDPIGSLAVIRAKDCSQAEFEKVAAISLAPALRFGTKNGKPLALLDISIVPTGAAGSVTLESIQSTILLQQVEGELRTIGQTFTAASKPTTITLSVTPTRCDMHVVAEDKIGTLIPFRVTTPGFHNELFTIASPLALKNQFYSFVQSYCGWAQ